MKPSLPQGTRDFGASTLRKREHIFATIRKVFELYGFQPLETPAMENLETLMGKYGEEGDKLIFKILNNGLDNPTKEKKAREDFDKVLSGKNNPGITERALKYDLTIPFARYVAMNQGQLNFPFKRYQIQPVWRADRPQRGRYREFYQCDADTVGSNSLLNEIELIQVYFEVFNRLKLAEVELKINHRKILAALAAQCGGADKITDITVAIDKLDKIGLEKVKTELSARGFDSGQLAIIESYLSITGSNVEKMDRIGKLLGESDTAKKGIADLQYLLDNTAKGSNLVLDFTLARGLNYYTGVILEAKAPPSVNIGSIGGGGRYDDLTGLFGVPGIPGVGISFGVDRIYDVLEELNLFPENIEIGTQVLFLNAGEKESRQSMLVAQQLRANGIRVEVYPEQAKIDRQFKYAEKKNIPFVATIGEEELANGNCKIKDIRSGKQETVSISTLTQYDFK